MAALSAAIDPVMWLHMVNVKTPYLTDLELESMKKLFGIIKGIVRSAPQQLLRRTHQFIFVVTWDLELI